MNELISLTQSAINGELQQTVNARELHAFLEVGKDFSTWIKARLETLGSVKNEDYLLTKIGEQLPSGTKYKTEYYLTLDVAKHLAMMEKNEKGKQARQYFIECEKQLNAQQSQLPTDPFLLIAHFAQQAYLMQHKQAEMDSRLIKVEQKQQQLNQDNDHFTIKGFCSLHQLDLSNGKMSALSRKAKKLSDVKDYTYHEITDPRWGKVKTYHIDILAELFEFEKLI